MAKFVKLTLLSGTPILINMDLVSDIYWKDKESSSEVSMLTSYLEDCFSKDTENHFHVKETPEEIIEMLNK